MLNIKLFILIISISPFLNAHCTASKEVKLIHQAENKKVKILVDGELFTAYFYHDTLNKPVLFPIFSPSGNYITRGYPLNPRPNERADHPHHIGHWFNYGNVNGLDFWNNSYKIKPEHRKNYGNINHVEVLKTGRKKSSGMLKIRTEWVDHAGNVLLEEITSFTFSGTDSSRTIGRKTKLTAVADNVLFSDNKEGLFAIRMARAFEFPTTKPVLLTNESGNVSKKPAINNTGVDGSYVSSNGKKDENVWGTRAKWVTLSTKIADENIGVTIMDHPSNPGYPTYWHARTYGLFSANPLGQRIFSDGENVLNLRLDRGESVTFRYQILISSGNEQFIKSNYQDFISDVK